MAAAAAAAAGGQEHGGPAMHSGQPRVAVKICGVCDVASALASAELGADYLGLNFWPGSPRCLDLGRAREIAAAVRVAAPRIALVGVFVNPTPRAVQETADAVGLDLLQWSGDEPAAAVRPFAGRSIKALRTQDETAVAAWEECWGLLFDAPRSGAGLTYGGTGRAWAYGAAAGAIRGPGGRRVFLAGGLGLDNVRQVVADLRPFAVDVCSRVESAPGKKDPQLLRQLFEEVRNGQATTAT
jgi:phosphoribosylanthranilate isomerase